MHRRMPVLHGTGVFPALEFSTARDTLSRWTPQEVAIAQPRTRYVKRETLVPILYLLHNAARA